MASHILLKVTIEKGEGEGTADPAEIAEVIGDEIDGTSVYVETNDGDGEREYKITGVAHYVA